MSELKKFRFTDHPSITLIAGRPKLRVFEDFVIEEKLPKFAVKVTDPAKLTTNMDDMATGSSGDTNMSNSDASKLESERDTAELRRILEGLGQHVSTVSSARWDRDRYIRNKLNEIRDERRRISGSEGPVVDAPKKTVLSRIVGMFSHKEDPSPAAKPEYKFDYDIEEAFERIKDRFTLATTDMLERNKRVLDSVMKRLETAGQYQKVNELASHAFILANELTLAEDGNFNKYITEAQLIDFMLKSEKGINVEFLRYYDELMPTEVIEKKIAADNLMVFDNYAVIHYDTKVEKFGHEITPEEERRDRERRRDPILVGLIQGSRKLHYICDWVTKEDDLTLEKVEELIGEKAHTLSKIEKDLLEEKARVDEVTFEVQHLQDMIVNVNQSVDTTNSF